MAYVYVVKAQGMDIYKIGIATSADARLEKLRTGSPVGLDLVRSVHCDDAGWAERFLHGQLNQYRSHGEWFSLDDKQLEAVHHLLDIVADWKPKPNLVSLMVRYGYPPAQAVLQVYEPENQEQEREAENDFNAAVPEVRAERIIRDFGDGLSLRQIAIDIYGVGGGGNYNAALAEIQSVLRNYLGRLKRGNNG